MFMNFSKPKDPRLGSDYEKTLLGSLLTPSCLIPQDKSPFFTEPSKKNVQELEKISEAIHKVRQKYYCIDCHFLYAANYILHCTGNHW